MIYLPCSLGDALDRLAILNLRCTRWTDEPRQLAEQERDFLLLHIKLRWSERMDGFLQQLELVHAALWDCRDQQPSLAGYETERELRNERRHLQAQVNSYFGSVCR